MEIPEYVDLTPEQYAILQQKGQLLDQLKNEVGLLGNFVMAGVGVTQPVMILGVEAAQNGTPARMRVAPVAGDVQR